MNLRRLTVGLLAAFGAVALLVCPADAAAPQSRHGRPFGQARPTHPSTIDNARRIDVNSINMYVTNVGSFAYDREAGDSGLWFPKGTDRSMIYAAGLWLGAEVEGQVRTVVAEYDQEYGPGAMVAGDFDNPSRPEYIVYKMARWTGNPEDSAHVERVPNAEAFEDELVHHSWSEYILGAVPHGAPWKMYRLPYLDVVAPADTDSVSVQGPDVLGDQMLWAVYNDADPTLHTNDAGNSTPLGIEIQQTTFAFNRQGALGNTVFIKYKLINKGTNTLNNMYISQWSDPDLGGSAGFTDDLVGCDVTEDELGRPRSIGFVYNSSNNDGGYGSTPPALGFDFFQGPNVGTSESPNYLGMSSFNKYSNGTDPTSPEETYNYMRGLNSDGSDQIDPRTQQVTTFAVSGDPVGGGGWLDTNPADRRMMLSSGPFSMAPGDSQEVVVGIVVGQCRNRLKSITTMKFFDKSAQSAFDLDFDLPSPPAAPVTHASVDHGKVTLTWDDNPRSTYGLQRGYDFEGYIVYQGATVAGPWTPLAVYDRVGGALDVYDEVFDLNTCSYCPQCPIIEGNDNGVRFSHTATTDAIRGGALHDATNYYYAVTAIAYNPIGVPKVLETAQVAVTAVPQRAASGTDLETATVTEVTYLQKDTTKPPATDVVTVEVVNPEQITGHTYKVIFEPLSSPYVGPIGTVEDATISYSWTVVDSTTGQVRAAGQLNRNGDDDYQVVDGVRVRLTGKYQPELQDAFHTNVGPNRRAIEGVNFGMQMFDGGAGYPVGSVGGMASSIDPVADPDSFTTVELRFDATNPQMAYRYFRLENESDGGAINGRVYPYAGRFSVPFTVWDMVTGRQLDVGFVERMITADDGTYLPPTSQPASLDSTWNPSSDDLGDREYLIVFRSAYGAADKPSLQLPLADGEIPVMWELNAKLRGPSDVIDNGDKFTFLWASPAKDNDIYVFNTSALVQDNAALSRGNLSRIRAVPNPYYARSGYELNQFSRKIRFVNMPEQCTVRIYNLAGQLVRTLRKTDASTSVLEWDIETENALPVGSGVYVFHVEVPGVGEYVGRLVVFMEKERLNSF